MLERSLDVEVEAELGELDADLAVEVALAKVVHHAQVVGRNGIRLIDPGQVLAEAGVERADSLDLELRARPEGAFSVLAGHEAAHGALGEPEPGEAVPQPAVAGHPEEQSSHGQRLFGSPGLRAPLTHAGGTSTLHREPLVTARPQRSSGPPLHQELTWHPPA